MSYDEPQHSDEAAEETLDEFASSVDALLEKR